MPKKHDDIQLQRHAQLIFNFKTINGKTSSNLVRGCQVQKRALK